MKLFLFCYNAFLIILYGAGFFLLSVEYLNNRDRKIQLYGAGAYLFYVLDAMVIFLAEFFLFSSLGSGFSHLISFPPFKIFISAGICFFYTLIFREMLRLKLKPVHIIAISCPVPVLSTIIYAMPDSAFKIWLFYSIRQIWVLFLCAAYFIILKKHPEPHFYGRKFRKMMTVYTTFIFLILAEDSFAIPNMKIVGNIIPWLNERNIMEDIMTIVVLVMVAKLVLDNQKENRQIRESILAAALEDRKTLTQKNLEIENELQALKAQIHENNKADEAYETAFINRYGLTAREADVLRLMIAGKSNPEIADELYISAGTVKFHAHQIYEKTGCQRRSQLIVLYSSGISKNA